MGRIYFTSDLHFSHNKEFIYKSRGFNSVQEMNERIVKNWNEVVQPDDDVYVLGDLMLNDIEEGMRLLKMLNGHIHIILGNHDTKNKIELYRNCYNVVEIEYALPFKYKKNRFFLSHYPTIIGDENIWNLYGHTHQKENITNPRMYHVGVDSHECKPVNIEDILVEIKGKL